ncbi:MAG: prolyl aminopeptidase [Cellvibrionaceae bacterium]|nr:prolyl aminopeptidase [Cellvibrionaceae bacterium]
MKILYPDIKPYATHALAVDNIHTLHVEECGSKSGIPVLFLHGGPGSGCRSLYRRYFDPDKYRIILYDQRGAGRSSPHACLEDNTTQHLLDDIEKIRQHLKVEQWMLLGGSWGSTLALLYAQRQPEKVLSMILRGVFLGRQQDLQWFYQGGAARIFPDYWSEFIQPIRTGERDNIIQAYYKQLSSANEIARMHAAKAWSLWEGRCATLRPSPEVVSVFSEPHLALSLALIETHFFVNHCFIEENQILQHSDALKDIPGVIIHGRYDMVCPLENAVSLYNQWPDAQLQIIRDAGHSAQEPGIVDALVKATDKMAKQLSGNPDICG